MAQARRKPAKAVVATAWREFWNTPEGKAAIGALMARFSVYSPIQTTNPTSMAVSVGERNVAAWIAEMIGMRPEDYVDQRSEVEKLSDKLLEKYGA